MGQAVASNQGHTHAPSGHLDHDGGETKHERQAICGLLASFGAVFGWVAGVIAGWHFVTMGSTMAPTAAEMFPLFFGWAFAGSGGGALIGLVLAVVVLSIEAIVRRGH